MGGFPSYDYFSGTAIVGWIFDSPIFHAHQWIREYFSVTMLGHAIYFIWIICII